MYARTPFLGALLAAGHMAVVGTSRRDDDLTITITGDPDPARDIRDNRVTITQAQPKQARAHMMRRSHSASERASHRYSDAQRTDFDHYRIARAAAEADRKAMKRARAALNSTLGYHPILQLKDWARATDGAVAPS